jgi:broad specificity phosphatase PhoE
MGPTGCRVVDLVQHGRTGLNVDGRLRGHLDPPLDEVGVREASDLGHAFASLPVRPVCIVSGPLARTRETATAIARL